MNDQNVLTANAVFGWSYTRPQVPANTKMQLLTTGGVCVVGTWEGELGEHYVGWAPLLRRDKAEERRILARYKNRLTEKTVASKLMGFTNG